MGLSMEIVTAKAVFDLFCMLDKAKQEEFLRLLGRTSTILTPLIIASEYDGPQKLDHRLSDSRTHEEG
jgi:hypothetical protein